MAYRIFVPGGSALLTDHLPHGEGLICWNLLSRLAAHGHDIVSAVHHPHRGGAPVPFEVRVIEPLGGLGATGYTMAAAPANSVGSAVTTDSMSHVAAPVRQRHRLDAADGSPGSSVRSSPAGPPTIRPTPARRRFQRAQDVLLGHRHRAVQRRSLVLLADTDGGGSHAASHVDPAPPARCRHYELHAAVDAGAVHGRLRRELGDQEGRARCGVGVRAIAIGSPPRS